MPNGMNIQAVLDPQSVADAQAIEQQRQIAQALMAQGMSRPQPTQMVGNIAVRQSPLEGLGRLAQTYVGMRNMDVSNKRMVEMLRGQQDRWGQDLDAFTQAMSGTPTKIENYTPDTFDANDNPWAETATGVRAPMGGAMANVTPGIAPDKNAALAIALRSTNPMLQSAGSSMLTNMLKAPSWKLGERYNAQTGMKEKFMYNENDPTQIQSIGGQEAAKMENWDGQVVNPYQVKPGQVINNPNKPFGIVDGQIVPNTQFQQYEMGKAKAGATNINNNMLMKQESAESQAVGKAYGDQFNELQKAGVAANSKINKLDRLNQLLEGVNTGKLTPAGVELASMAKSLGFKVDPNLGNLQAAQALSNEMALELRNPSGGAGMPGAMSDKDREFLVTMVPGIEKTPEGRKLISESYKKMAQRDIDVARMARDYRQKHGHLDEGFYNELQQYADNHPLFGNAQSSNAAGAKFLGFE